MRIDLGSEMNQRNEKHFVSNMIKKANPIEALNGLQNNYKSSEVTQM